MKEFAVSEINTHHIDITVAVYIFIETSYIAHRNLAPVYVIYDYFMVVCLFFVQ